MNYERLLHNLRRLETDSPKRKRLIDKAKKRLGKNQPGRNLAKERWAETMWV